jgi:hypothetical protein
VIAAATTVERAAPDALGHGSRQEQEAYVTQMPPWPLPTAIGPEDLHAGMFFEPPPQPDQLVSPPVELVGVSFPGNGLGNLPPFAGALSDNPLLEGGVSFDFDPAFLEQLTSQVFSMDTVVQVRGSPDKPNSQASLESAVWVQDLPAPGSRSERVGWSERGSLSRPSPTEAEPIVSSQQQVILSQPPKADVVSTSDPLKPSEVPSATLSNPSMCSKSQTEHFIREAALQAAIMDPAGLLESRFSRSLRTLATNGTSMK